MSLPYPVEISLPLSQITWRPSFDVDFYVGYSPERIDPGNKSWTFVNTPKVQFDWVFIPGFEDGNMPDFRAKDDPVALSEEQRVPARDVVSCSPWRGAIRFEYAHFEKVWTTILTGSFSLVASCSREYFGQSDSAVATYN